MIIGSLIQGMDVNVIFRTFTKYRERSKITARCLAIIAKVEILRKFRATVGIFPIKYYRKFDVVMFILCSMEVI